MNATVPPLPPASRFGLKHALFLVLGLMALFVICHNERFIVDHGDPQWTYYAPVRGLLLLHGIAGLVALLLGATQFSTRLRTARPALHRLLGRCYLAGVAVAAPLAIVITVLHNGLPTRIALITQSALWLLASSLALVFVRRRDFVRHREWMIRSYAMTLFFLIDRVLDAIPGLADLDADGNPTISWISILIAWVVPTLIIAWPGFLPPIQVARRD